MNGNDEIDDDAYACADGRPEHDYETTYEESDGWQGVCRRCGAEAWEDR